LWFAAAKQSISEGTTNAERREVGKQQREKGGKVAILKIKAKENLRIP